jgi:hypothetical protein
MGIICDTSVLIAAEKRRFDLATFLRLKLVDTGRFMLTR